MPCMDFYRDDPAGQAALPVASAQHKVIDARTGKVLLEGATAAQYVRWYDHHCFWRAPRDISEVQPEQRAAYSSADANTHFLVED